MPKFELTKQGTFVHLFEESAAQDIGNLEDCADDLAASASQDKNGVHRCSSAVDYTRQTGVAVRQTCDVSSEHL